MFSVPSKLTDVQARHNYILENFVLNKLLKKKENQGKRDIDIIKENHRFVWQEDDNVSETWEVRLARKYYDKLFKEYCIADLTRYKENKVALRWRTESEVIDGKGQFQCGSRHCPHKENLRTWEVNFAYHERGTRKNTLVKLRLCEEHSKQLNYTSRKREVKRLKHLKKESTKNKYNLQRQKDFNLKIDTSPSSTPSQEEENKKEPKYDECHSIDEHVGSDIWNKTAIETEQISRESDFAQYLDELLL